MKRATVYWFSGTGSAWALATRIAEGLDAAGIPSTLRAIEDLKPPRRRLAAARALFPDGNGDPLPVDANGLDVVCFPVYAFTTPAIVDRFLSRLPVAIGRKAAVVAAMGGKGYEGRALRRASRLLRENGREVLVTAAIEMPEAFVQFIPATGPEEAESRSAAGLAEAGRLADLIAAGGREIRKASVAGMAKAWIASVGFSRLARRLLGLFWSSSKACTACGLCAARCPARVITMAAGRPHWKGSCEDCQRCANICPVGALRISVPKIVLMLLPAFLPWGRWLSAALGSGDALVRFLLGLSGLVASAWIMGKLLWLADLVPGLRDVLSLSFAGGFRRRLAPGFAEELARKASAGRS